MCTTVFQFWAIVRGARCFCCQASWHAGASGVECRATVMTFTRLCSNMFAYRVWCAKFHAHFLWHHFFSFSPNHHLRKQALDFLFFLVNTHYYSSNEIKGMHFSMQPQCLYISLSMGNAKEKRGTTLDQPINYVIRFLHHHQTVATSVC